MEQECFVLNPNLYGAMMLLLFKGLLTCMYKIFLNNLLTIFSKLIGLYYLLMSRFLLVLV